MASSSSISLQGLKIIAFFVILIAGFFGSALPSLGKYFAKQKNFSPARVRIVSKLLTATSAGIVLTTALVHVFSDGQTLILESGGIFRDPSFGLSIEEWRAHQLGANDSFSSPLHDEHDHPYPYPALFTVFSVFVTFFVASEIASWGTREMKKLHHRNTAQAKKKNDDQKQQQQQESSKTPNNGNISPMANCSSTSSVAASFLRPSSSHSHEGNEMEELLLRFEDDLLIGAPNNNNNNSNNGKAEERTNTIVVDASNEQIQEQSKELSVDEKDRLVHRIHLIQIVAGVAIHSVILGVTLGISRSADTARVLMLVMMLDCMFDGIAVGNLIMLADLSSCWSALGYVSTFAFMAPLGIAIGLGVSGSENLRVQGIMSCIGAGLLLNMAFEFFHEIFDHHHHHSVGGAGEEKKIVKNENDASNNNKNKTETGDDDQSEESVSSFQETLCFRLLCYFFVLAGGAFQMALRVWE